MLYPKDYRASIAMEFRNVTFPATHPLWRISSTTSPVYRWHSLKMVGLIPLL